MASRLRSSLLVWIRTPSTPFCSPTGPTALVACSTASLPQRLQTSWKANLPSWERPMQTAWWLCSCQLYRPQQKSGNDESRKVKPGGGKERDLCRICSCIASARVVDLRAWKGSHFIIFLLFVYQQGFLWHSRLNESTKLILLSVFLPPTTNIDTVTRRGSHTCSKHRMNHFTATHIFS